MEAVSMVDGAVRDMMIASLEATTTNQSYCYVVDSDVTVGWSSHTIILMSTHQTFIRINCRTYNGLSHNILKEFGRWIYLLPP